VHRMADLTASVTRLMGSVRAGTEVSVGVTVSFGGRAVASTSAVRNQEGTRAAFDIQQPLPVGTGFGYQIHGETGMRNASSGALQYQGAYGRYEVRREMTGTDGHTNVSIAGALVGIGGGLYATRPVRNSFALVRVPGVDGVRAYSSHQEIGRTNRRGNLLIPDLLPYYGNELNIADTDIPIDYTVSDVRITLAPPYRGGAVVLFPVRRIQRATGSVMLLTSAGEEQPSFGEISIVAAGERMTSPLGNAGEFYFENLPEGRHEASVTHEGRSCVFMLTVPQSTEAAITLGTFTCTVAQAQ
jgi:outer membrane usher protein